MKRYDDMSIVKVSIAWMVALPEINANELEILVSPISYLRRNKTHLTA
jgi:hypothetical protein